MTRLRLQRGTRLLSPLHGTYYKYGGRWVSFHGFATTGLAKIRMSLDGQMFFFLVEPEAVGLPRRQFPPLQVALPF